MNTKTGNNHENLPAEVVSFIEKHKDDNAVPNVGLTYLVPPELIFNEGCRPVDVNNWVKGFNNISSAKLCAWTASWRDIILEHEEVLDALVVVGGHCQNSLTDAEMLKLNTNIKIHHTFYPYDGDADYLQNELRKLSEFISSIKNEKKQTNGDVFSLVKTAKHLAKKLDALRVEKIFDPSPVYRYLASCIDLDGNLNEFIERGEKLLLMTNDLEEPENRESYKSVGLIGVPPIINDIHRVCYEIGLHIVFDEFPYECIDYYGDNVEQLSRQYAKLTFTRPIEHRIKKLKKILDERNCRGLIHNTQFGCHHILDDKMLRESLDIPVLTIQSDRPRSCDRQILLRLEAFYESIQ